MTSDSDLWTKFLASERAFLKAQMDLIRDQRALIDGANKLVDLIGAGIQKPTERSAALRMLALLPVSSRLDLFPSLISLASYGHGLIGVAKELILSLPRDWVVNNIEGVAEPILEHGGYEEYQRFLELYLELDQGLARRLSERAVQNPDQDIADAGKDMLRRLSELSK